MDIVAHALWTAAAAMTAQRWARVPVGWSIAWGIAPDLVSFGIPAVVRITRYLTGASKTLLPDGTGPRFDWVWNVYNGSHSAVIFAMCFATAYLVLRRPAWAMLGWALHIAIDIGTHQGMFAIQFLWPFFRLSVNGVRWETPWLLVANYLALGVVFCWLWRGRRLKHEGPASLPGSQGLQH